MADTRSTRRVIKQESDAPSIPANTGFASVEGDDDAKQVANNKSNEVGGGSNQEPARMQPPDSFQVNDQSDETVFDMDQLEAELNVAISAEMGESTTVDPAEPADAVESTDSDAPNKESADAEVIGTKTGEPVQSAPTTISEEQTEPRSKEARGGGLLGLVMTPLTAPVAHLPAGARLILNFTAISLAFWVPIVWIAAMTDGFGYLSSSQNEVTRMVAPVADSEERDSTTEPESSDDLTTS